MTDRLVTVLGSFRVTIPKGYRKDYNIKVGDSLKVVIKDGMLCLIPVDLVVKERRSKN